MSDTEDSAPESAPEPAPDPVSAEPDPGEIPLEQEWRGGHLHGTKRDE